MSKLFKILCALCLITLSSSTTLSFYIVSDTSNWLEGPNTPSGAFALVMATGSSWTATIIGANWIWESSSGPVTPGYAYFYKYFLVPGTVTSATLEIAADGYFTTFLNNKNVNCDDTTSGRTASSKKTCTVDISLFTAGINCFHVDFQNVATGDCGLLYRLSILATYS
ncbi:hypothetical protein SteCoe_36507 [Stentor coeruleus]|uniref:PA14 domain-containing protein n=1 Tax=Stentor coeruleus TaxID=5963 RepID=A0A1R2AQ70_9CILI|nr:hypothetical protein SteCoe_36507 [Stentor coeruleus]